MDKKIDKKLSIKIAWITFLGNVFILLEHANLGVLEKKTIIGFLFLCIDKVAISMMNWFFFITAYFLFRSINNYKDLFNRLKRRLYTLGIPYVIWNSIGMILYFVSGEYSVKDSILMIIRRTYLFFNGTGCADGPLWYIARLFTFFIVTPLIYFVLYNINTQLFILVEILLCFIISLLKLNNFDFLFFFPFYLMGAYLSMRKKDKFECWLNKYNYKDVIILILCFLIVMFKDNIKFFYLNMAFRFVSLNVIFFIIKIFSFNISKFKIVFGGGMYLYCSHEIVYRMLKFVLFKSLSENYYIYQIVFIVISGFIIITSWYFLEKYAPNILSILSGGRNKRVG